MIAASDGLGVEGAVVAAGDVSYDLAKGTFIFVDTTAMFSGKAIQPSIDVPSTPSHFGLCGVAPWNCPVERPTDVFNCQSTSLTKIHANISTHLS